MNSINGSRGSIGDRKPVFAALPPLAYTTVALEELSLPHGLFDDNIPVNPPSPLDRFMPLIAAKTGNEGPLIIVDGCKRFKRMLENKTERCACGVFDGLLDDVSIGLVRVFLNHERPMSVRESVCFLAWLRDHCAGSDGEETMDSLGFSAGRRSELEPLLTCADAVVDAVDEGRIAARLAPDFCLMEAGDRKAFLDAFRGIELSLQTQREFLEWLPEIAYNGKTTVKALLDAPGIQKIVNDEILNGPQKIEALRALVHSWKFPRYDETLKKWKKLAAATARSAVENEPSSKVIFVPSHAFEMNKLEIRITLSHAPAAKEIFQKLSEVPKTVWSQLMYPV